MAVGNHSGRAERLKVACDHYLDLGQGLRDQSGETAIWPCPTCGRSSFVASFGEGVAGCSEAFCTVPASMGLLELMCYLDEDIEVGDERGASEKFREILEAAVRREQEREARLKEERQKTREERYWRKGLTKARAREAGERGWPEQRLF
ncbi:MAG: hypothetical protein ACR2GU_10125 [Rubrobacteraceae bacterium]